MDTDACFKRKMHLFRSGSRAEDKVTAHLGGSGEHSWNITAMNQRVASIPEGLGGGRRNATNQSTQNALLLKSSTGDTLHGRQWMSETVAWNQPWKQCVSVPWAPMVQFTVRY